MFQKKSDYNTKAGEIITGIFSFIFSILGITWIISFKDINVSNISNVWEAVGSIFLILIGSFIGGMLGMTIGKIIDWLLSLFIN